MKIIKLNLAEFDRLKDLIEQIEPFVGSEFTENAHIGTKEDLIEYRAGLLEITLSKNIGVVENEN